VRQDSRTALVLLTVGLASLFTYSAVYSPTTYDPRELQDEHVGDIVRLHGTVHEMNVNEGVTFIRLERRPGLDIVSFDRIQAIEHNSTVRIDGTVDLYHGKLEVLVDRIAVEDD
jgi:aspartyl-tRNA synthetase